LIICQIQQFSGKNPTTVIGIDCNNSLSEVQKDKDTVTLLVGQGCKWKRDLAESRDTLDSAGDLNYARDTKVSSKQMGKDAYELRCLRCVQGRLAIPWGQTQAVCPYCGQTWRITWVTPTVAKIRGRLLSKETP